jgi:hypothetical protein
VLLFIHGIGNDDPQRTWQAALDRALRREGTETLKARGYRVIAPSYRAELEAEDTHKGEQPPTTYRKTSKDDYARAGSRYWKELASLERTGIRGHVAGGGIRSELPADALAEQVMPRLFADAVAYRRDASRRNAIYTRLLSEIPPRAELVILAHSLGSVVAADLLYRLPEDARLRMLITLGSPLGLTPMRAHLERKRSRFPYEIAGPWVNLVGREDYVTGYRGLSPVFPEALDVFLDTGRDPREVHKAVAYLDQSALAHALEWLERPADSRHHSGPQPDALPDLLLPAGLLSVVVGAQYALRLERAQERGNTRVRFGEARAMLADSIADRAAEAGFRHPILNRLTLDNAEYLRGRFEQVDIINLLLTAWTANPIMPYEIDVPTKVRRGALEALAFDLNVPSQWAETIRKAEGSARKSQRLSPWTWRRAALAVAGAAAIVAAPVLVLAAAPAGLTGGAAIVAGLAALGPGGMLGGVGIVGLVGGAGGAAAAQALISGTAAEVEETVIHLQALALSKRELGYDDASVPEWSALVAMEDAVTDAHARVSHLSDDDAEVVKELTRKRESIRRALDWFIAHSLDPGRLGSGDGQDD